MQLRYKDEAGRDAVYELAEEPVLIGRDEKADVVVADERASRTHCEIRLWAGSYVLKDLDTPNGTHVNGRRVEVTQLRPGDEIRIGTSVLSIQEQQAGGESTAIREIDREMDEGKGYGTILRKIVDDIDGDKEA
jgi:pSer/pThr/pTyr-binding forkhead associated (FHA) protein